MISYRDLLMVSKGNRYQNLRTFLFAQKFKMGGKFVKEYLRTVSGVPCVLTNSVGKPTVDYKIYGETYQSPEMYNPILKDKDGYSLIDSDGYLLRSNDPPQYIIKSVGDRTKNLFDKNSITFTPNNFLGENGELITNLDWEVSDYIPIEGYQVTLNCQIGKDPCICLYDKDKNLLVSKRYQYNKTITVSSEQMAYYCRFSRYYTISVDSFQLEYGSKSTSYEPYGYKIPITTNGKNLWNAELTDGYGLDSAGLPISNNKRCATLEPIHYANIDNLKISYKSTDVNTHVMYSVFNENTFVRRLNCMSGDSIDVSGGNKVYFSFYWVGITVSANDISEIQLELGDTVTEYEPYHKPVPTSIYLDEPLRKIGDYADVIDFERGVVERKMGKLVYTGNEIFRNTTYDINLFMLNMEGYLRKKEITSLNSHYQTQTNVNVYTEVADMRCAFYVNPNNLSSSLIYIRDSRFGTIADFKAYLKEQYDAGTPVTVYYVLAESTTETLTLPKLPTFNGTAVISADTEIQPSNMEITYRSGKGE